MGRGVTVKRDMLAKMLRELGATQKHIAVGVLGAKAQAPHKNEHGEKSEATVAQVAQWNSYGTSTIPARPFLAIAVARHARELLKMQRRLATALVMQKIGLDRALGLLGAYAVGIVKQTIVEGVPPPNAESTIKMKGSSTPLINTGQLRNSITFELREGSE